MIAARLTTVSATAALTATALVLGASAPALSTPALAAPALAAPALAARAPALASAADPSPGTGTLTRLASLGGVGSFATGMNERGDLIGSSVDAAGTYQAVVWWQGRRSPTPLGIAGGSPADISSDGHVTGFANDGMFLWRDGSATYRKGSFSALSINDRDQIAGTVTRPGGTTRAFVWQAGRLTTLPAPAGSDTRAVDINNRGQVVGAVTPRGASTERAVLWQDGRMIELGTLGGEGSTPAAINDRGQVGGTSTVAGSAEEHPFLWQRGRMTDLLAGTTATTGRVADLNDSGALTGTARFGTFDSRPVVWRDGRMLDIGLPGHTGGGGDINNRGDVTGPTWPDPQSTAVPFRWRDGATTLFPEPVSDIAITIVGIDDRGRISVDQETSQHGNIVLRSS